MITAFCTLFDCILFLYEPSHERTVVVFFCLGKNKDADQLCSNCTADQPFFVFTTWLVQFPYFLNPEFQVSSINRPVCVRPGWKSEDQVSHVMAQIV